MGRAVRGLESLQRHPGKWRLIFYLTEKTGSAMVLSMASLVGFLPYAVFGPAIGVLVDRHDRKKDNDRC